MSTPVRPLILAAASLFTGAAIAGEMTLFEYPDFGGRRVAVHGPGVVVNLNETGFNDRGSSMRVEGGYWVFCTDAHFEGTCRTFGPGEYPTLPWEINRKISSGRRISDHYPYPAPPSWGQR